jgi:hypothetical protein
MVVKARAYNADMAETEIQKPSDFTQLDVAMGLRALALYGGNCQRASQALTAEGRPIPPGRLKKWKEEDYPVQYEEVVYTLRQKIGEQVSDGAMETAANAQQLSNQMIDLLQENLAELPASQLAKAALNMAQTSRTNIEVARLLRDQPTQITEVRTLDDSLDTLKELDLLDIDPGDVEEKTVDQ